MSGIFGFEREPYLRGLDVEILSVEPRSDHWIAILDDTILYPEGGGQPSDRGRLNEAVVSQVGKSETGLLHVLESPIEPGPATLTVDWQRRYDHMQQHTAQHILTRCALNRFAWATRSFHIGPRVSDIELDCPPPGPEQMEGLEDAVAEVIVQSRPIRGFRVDAAKYGQLEVRSRGLPAGHRGDIRLVEIEGFDLNTCGGTHVATTSEVESLKLVSAEPLRGGCRLHWVAGKRVRQRLARQDDTLTALRSVLDTGDDDIVASVGRKLDQLQQARRSLRSLEKQLAELIVDGLTEMGDRLVDLHLAGPDSILLRPIVERFAKRARGQVALLTADSEDGSLFALVVGKDSPLDLRRAGADIAEALVGRGGGAGQIYQGKARSLEHRARAVSLLETLLA